MTSAYSTSEVTAYLQHIGIPPSYYPSTERPPALDIKYLHLLHMHHISTIPYENLSLHYSRTRVITLDPQALYAELMAGRGRGGYCMEISIFFNHMLRALGFNTYMVGVKARSRDLEKDVPAGPYLAYTDIVNIVTISTSSTSFQKYMLEPSFDGDGPTLPLPLDPSPSPVPLTNLSPQQVRLIYAHIPCANRHTLPKRWIYQYRNDPVSGNWNDLYAFAEEVEWFEEDFEVSNWYTSMSPMSFRTTVPLLVKCLRARVDAEDEVMSDGFASLNATKTGNRIEMQNP